jgi:hypothetical protein
MASERMPQSGMESADNTVSKRAFRARYGDAMADITETAWRPAGGRVHAASTQDVKARLRAIVALPEARNLHSLDSLAHALLMDPAWRRFRKQSLEALTQGQLAECAQYALDHFPPAPKTLVDSAEVRMTLALLGAARTWHAPRRINLLRAALTLVFGTEYRHASAIIRKAHGELRGKAGAGSVPNPGQ